MCKAWIISEVKTCYRHVVFESLHQVPFQTFFRDSIVPEIQDSQVFIVLDDFRYRFDTAFTKLIELQVEFFEAYVFQILRFFPSEPTHPHNLVPHLRLLLHYLGKRAPTIITYVIVGEV